VRLLVDYRAALRNPSGVGEYTRQLVSALAHRRRAAATHEGLEITLFSSSWKDRLVRPAPLADARIVDRRVPVRMLNFAWHRLGWPAAEALTGQRFDVVHSFHPLLMPSRSAAQVVTIYDLDFLTHPERTRAEIRRDYPALVTRHARAADHVIVISQFTKAEVERRLDVPADRISICAPGAPDWTALPAVPSAGYLLFVGTLEPRKNVGALLDAYERLLGDASHRPVPDLILAGHATEEAAGWLNRLSRPPLAGRARHIGYVEPVRRRSLYEGARVLVHPAHGEGFGMTVLEAMTLGVPVVAAKRGAIPEVLGDAGLLVDPEDVEALAVSIRRMLDDDQLARAAHRQGPERARLFSWSDAAAEACAGYKKAVARRAERN
jgi:glycosyltransferase involved in cell wall biosynthesis